MKIAGIFQEKWPQYPQLKHSFRPPALILYINSAHLAALFFCAAQWLALLALGRAWTLLGSRKDSYPEKCSKRRTVPTYPLAGKTTRLSYDCVRLH